MASGRPAPGAGGPPRQPPTIDLTATATPPEPVAPGAAPATPTEPPVEPAVPLQAQGSDPPAVAAEPAPHAPEPAPPQPEPRRPPPGPPPRTGTTKSITWLPFEPPWPLLGAGAAGGACVLLVLGGLWLAGAFTRRDDSAARLAQIESQLRELTARPVPAQVDPKAVEELGGRLGRMETRQAERLTTVEGSARTLAESFASLNRRIEAATALAETAQNSARNVDALAARMAALERTSRAAGDERHSGASEKAVRLVVGAAALRAAVERGDPFAAELAAVKPLAADPEALAALEPFAATGVPVAATLARELSELVPKLQRAAGAPAEGGLLERLQTSAGRLVRIRPIDEVPGDDLAAIVARIEVKAGQVDLAGALGELARLPAPIRAPAEGWQKKVQARTAALEASRRFAADALAALGRPSP